MIVIEDAHINYYDCLKLMKVSATTYVYGITTYVVYSGVRNLKKT